MFQLKKWWQFTIERFHPISHLTMILVFLIAHIVLSKSLLTSSLPLWKYVLLFLGVTAFYFKLRLYDEIKDYELDVAINPHRPLPRGLLNHKDLYRAIAICILLELVFFGVQGINSLATISMTILYSLLMYKEFFIKEKIRPHLTTYALAHTIVTFLLTFSIFSFLTQKSILDIIVIKAYLYFSITNWLLFNIFEFGRKTFAISEERAGVDTYSSLFGRWGAVFLVFSQAFIAHILMSSISLSGERSIILSWGMTLLILTLTVLSLNYALKNSSTSAKLYRAFSSAYIVLFFLIIIVSHFIF